MDTTTYQANALRPFASSAESVELFPDSIKVALDRIEEISSNPQANDEGPSAENVKWAKTVLLRVLPRHYLVGAEIDAFQREIHVNWENGDKRVTVFLPNPGEIKIYFEHVKELEVEHHLRPGANDPWAVSGVLRWLFE